MNKLTYEYKTRLYRAGKYQFKVPPVYTGFWSVDDWIKYIDYAGEWITDKG